LAKNLGWRIEFLTGGYKVFPFDELVNITKIISEVYGEKLWLNLGAITKEELVQFQPYIKGVVASIETISPELHKQICPDKAIQPYEQMLQDAQDLNLKTSMTLVIGLGEKPEHFPLLEQFIKKHNLDRITFYALKPVPGTPYEQGPTTEDYCYWINQTRKAFPEIQIIAGTTARRTAEVSEVLKAGADAITKFPSTKKFNSEQAQELEQNVKDANCEFISTLTKLPDINWDAEVTKLNLNETLESETKTLLHSYIKKMSKN
jgi:biotin synthase-like enzyme